MESLQTRRCRCRFRCRNARVWGACLGRACYGRRFGWSASLDSGQDLRYRRVLLATMRDLDYNGTDHLCPGSRRR